MQKYKAPKSNLCYVHDSSQSSNSTVERARYSAEISRGAQSRHTVGESARQGCLAKNKEM